MYSAAAWLPQAAFDPFSAARSAALLASFKQDLFQGLHLLF
jgi:hypothetical protein